VPLYAGRLERDGEAAARRFAGEALSLLVSVLLLFTGLCMAAMPWLMYLLAPGFVADPAQFELAVELTRITFPYLLFMALVALLGGVLNSLYRFAAAAAAPIVLNVFFIAALAFVLPQLRAWPGQVLAWTVALAGLAQFLLLAYACHRAGALPGLPRPRLTPGVRRLIKLMVPGMISAGAMQINLLIGTMIATLQVGAVSYIYYADRIYQLPLGLIGIGIGIVLLPDLTRKLRGGQGEAAMHSLNRSIELALVLTLPACLALLAIPLPIVKVLFERGAFLAVDSEATALALGAFAAGLPAYVLVKVLQPPFFAREDTVTPLRFALASVAVNIVLSLLLFWQIGFVGIAVATALSSWLNAALLGGRLIARGHLALDARLKARLPRSLLASLAMVLALLLAEQALAEWIAEGGLQRIAAVALLVGLGLVVYAGLALASGAVRAAELKGLLRRKA
jgi:putative peptidoglycan lipid II flippase